LNFFFQIFRNLSGVCLATNHFYSKQNCQNRPKGVFAKQLLGPKIPQQKSNQLNKVVVPGPKQNQLG